MKTCDFYQTHTHVHPRHLLSHHFIVSWGFCVPNIEFFTSAETKATRAEVWGTMAKDGWLVLFFHVQQNRQFELLSEGRGGRERVRGRNGGDQCRSWSLPLLLYLGYISTSWQTNVLVHNSEWLRSDKGMWPVWQVIDTFFKIQKHLCRLCLCLCGKRSRLFTTRGHRLHHILWLSQIEL